MPVDVRNQSDHAARTGAWGDALAAEDFVLVPGAELTALLPAGDLDRLANGWDRLELDEALFDGGTYRYRRYGRLRADGDSPGHRRFTPLPHAPFWQSAECMPDYGGRERVFGAISDETLLDPALLGLVAADLSVVERVTGHRGQWDVGLHMVRVVAVPAEPGSPTPEGRHRDGHDFVGMHLFRRTGCVGGESIVYREGRVPVHLTLTQRLDSLVVADTRLTHEVTPVVSDGMTGVRDMLLVDLNAT
ncbi:hypothetical protein CLV71_116140 [Actinophytocola oryzae]|uniref:2OG-Fe dioxygenase family protein n=1 Tax=Actinophytocola oryzae TaxID=502181 RepID=A0A4R7V6N0_9PSEU|nr:hypothetical protein CLV71_116140 [Actinophytocola oryzae]